MVNNLNTMSEPESGEDLSEVAVGNLLELMVNISNDWEALFLKTLRYAYRNALIKGDRSLSRLPMTTSPRSSPLFGRVLTS